MYGWKVNYFFSWLTSMYVNRFRSPARRRFGSILVIRLDEIGDMVTSLPVFDALKRAFPDSALTAWVTPLTASLVEGHPAIDRIVTAAPETAPRFDLVVDLRGSFATMAYALRHRPRFRLDRGTVRFRNKFLLGRHPHEVVTNLQVVAPATGPVEAPTGLRLPMNDADRQAAVRFLKDNGIGPFALFHPGARKVLRRWPGQRFAELGSRLREKRNLDIVFTGTEDELESIGSIRRGMPFTTHVFCGYGLKDLAALAARATVFVGNESGPMHVAAAAGVPVVALFGPGEPHVFAPYGERCTVIHHKLPCNPCGQVVCKHPENTCMNRITVREAEAAIDGLLD